MADYSDDISKLLFDLETQKEQTKKDIETSKKRSSEFTGFMEAFGTDGEALTEKWEREETEEKEYQEEVARERAEEQVRLEEERKTEETRIKKERQRQLKAKKNATASEVKSLKEKWKREDAELKLEQQRQIEEAEYNLQLLREEQKGESEKQADAFGNFLSILTGEAQQVSQEIQGVLEEADIEHIQDYSATNQMSEIGAAENLISNSVKAINKLKQEGIQEELSSDTDIAQLADRLDLLQKNLNELTSIGWGQKGMTYGSGEVRLENLDDVDTTAKTEGYYLKYQASTDKWIGAVATVSGFDPAGYEYVNDSSLYKVVNDTVLGNGLYCIEGAWTKIPINGYVTNKLPTGKHSGIAGTDEWVGSGSVNHSRIYNVNTGSFFLDELDQDTIVMFRLKVDVIPELNNTLIQARINFFAIRDGNDDPVLEDATIVEEYRIVLENDSYVLDETDSDKFILELGTDLGQGDYPGAYNDTNYKVELETATDGGTGQLKGDYFQAYNFQQTVAAQELVDGGGVEQERTFIFPVYVGDSSSQRGWGCFEINPTGDMVVSDASILSGLN